MLRRVRMSFLALVVLVTSMTTIPASAAAPDLERIAGGGRVQTATMVARAGWTSADRVLLATAVDYPDAVAASAFASALDAPLLLTDPNVLPSSVADVLADLGTSIVTILGGPRAVSTDVEQQLTSLGLQVTRVAGTSRWSTAGALADQVSRRGPVEVVAIALGDRADGKDAWPDALAAASLAGLDEPIPTLLTRRNQLPEETLASLRRLGPSKVVLLGGEGAIDHTVEQALVDAGYDVERFSGSNRFQTGVAVAQAAMAGPDDAHGDLDSTSAVFVSGEGFADALGAGALAAHLESPLLLVPSGVLADSVDAFIRHDATSFTSAYLVGGPKAVSEFVESELSAALTGEPRPEAPSCPPNSSPDCQYTYRHPIETWEDLAECESHGQWDLNTGNGYYGGLQFSLGTWQNVGGQGYPHQNSKWEQIHRGEILQERAGWGQWPHCSRELGLR